MQTIVVGAGAVGLAIGRALARRGEDVVVVERHRLIGSEVSSRNSEVIHAGIYYPPGSLKSRLCVTGKALLYPFLAEHGVAHKRIGKLLVATDDSQLGKLASYAQTAAANGVHDLRELTPAEVREIEPELHCTAALFSPSTGIIDSHGYMLALQADIEAEGGQVVLDTTVERIERRGGLFEIVTGGSAPGRVTCRKLMLAAGLGGTAIARTIDYPGGYLPPATYFARGQYYALTGHNPFRHLVYPMPDGQWLGIHVTLDLGGRAKFGPDQEWIETIDYSFNRANEARFYDAIRRYWPGLPDGALQPDTTGIRPKLYREGEPVPDFVIHGPEQHGLPGLVALFGIESPGLTASLAIGEEVGRRLDEGPLGV